MPPIFFVSFPFILLLLLYKGMGTKPAKAKPSEPSIEKVVDIIHGEGDEIIVIRKNKHQSD